jgi:hypothetical protein
MCRRHFVDADALAAHRREKPHKRRMHALRDTPYTPAEALTAAGLGSYTLRDRVRDTNVHLCSRRVCTSG